jgi:GntR family transcriptional regulator, rspAB operon transcriptional repressor
MLDSPALVDVLPIAPQIYEGLRSRVLFAQLLPGEPISKTEVAKSYRVSRQPVREAFIKLAEAKLVKIRPQRGTTVAYISHDAVMDARLVREAIEVDVVKQAAKRCDDAGRVELKAQLQAQAQFAEIDEREFLRLDDLFHQTLAGISDHPNAWAIIEDLKVHMDRDDGQNILDDLGRGGQPGYPVIGRLEGLAELRGVERALSHSGRR